MCKKISNHSVVEFSAIQILREINFRDLRSAEPAILAVLKALNLDFGKFQLWKIAKTHQKWQFLHFWSL